MVKTYPDTSPRKVRIDSLTVANDRRLVLIAGPCAIESRHHALEMAQALAEITSALHIGFIYKSSFDKANRTSLDSSRGVGISEGLSILAEVRESVGCLTVTDVHEAAQCIQTAQIVDVLQIPAFLCRQTDLLLAAGSTGKPILVKKGQFLAPWDITHVIDKIVSTGNEQILLCERGVSFGYNTLVSDFRALPILASTGFPVIFDATHSVQQPGGAGASSSGQREFIPILARAAVAIGIAGLFIETHTNPDQASSDSLTMIPLKEMPRLLEILLHFDHLAKKLILRP